MTTAVDTNIGRVIEVLAKIKQVRKDDVADAIGMKRSTFYRRFTHEDWSAREVAQLAAYFGVPVGVMFRETGDLLDTTSRFFRSIAA